MFPLLGQRKKNGEDHWGYPDVFSTYNMILAEDSSIEGLNVSGRMPFD